MKTVFVTPCFNFPVAMAAWYFSAQVKPLSLVSAGPAAKAEAIMIAAPASIHRVAPVIAVPFALLFSFSYSYKGRRTAKRPAAFLCLWKEFNSRYPLYAGSGIERRIRKSHQDR
jgi:hypothetical protein